MANRQQGQNLGPQTIRFPFLDSTDLRPGQETLITKDQVFLNGFFEAVRNPLGKADYYFVKRPGTSTYLTVAPTGPGRGCYAWKQTGKLYSVNNNKILSGSTDLGVTLRTTTNFVNFEETRPGATTQYLGVNDGQDLYLIGSDDSVIIMNNVVITSSSVANPTTITANSHGLSTGNKIIIRNHAGSTPSINDTIFTITKTGTNTFTIPVNVTVGGAGGTIGVFPSPNTTDLKYMDGYFFTMKSDGTIWNCSVDDPTTWPTTSFLASIMLPGRGIGLGRQNNVLVAFSDRHYQMFYDAANPFGSPLSNIEQAMQRVGAISLNTIAAQENTLFWVSNTLTGGFSVYRLDGTANLQDIGTPTLNRSLTNNFFLTPGSPSSKQVILTSGTSWAVPGDFNKFNNTVEAIGGGGGGAGADVSPNVSGGAGGGGAYSKINNFDPGGSGTINYVIGTGGSGATGTPFTGTNGGDTTFNVSSVVAKGGLAGGNGSTGGQASAGTGSTKFSGGNGGVGKTALTGGAGGGGAAGTIANGQNGRAAGDRDDGLNPNSVLGSSGGQGNPIIGGIGGTTPFDPNGHDGTDLDSTHGSGGGGAGGNATSPSGTGGSGGNGGLYGAGGGGGGAFASSGTQGTGGNGIQGIIKITYTPAGVSDQDAANGYILRISGHIFYLLNLVNNKETWVYDVQLGIWTLWHAGVNNISPFPIVNSTSFTPTGQPSFVVGQDITTGTLWKIDPSIGQDNLINFEYRIQTNPITFGTMQRKFYDRVDLIGDRPTSSTPILISYSDDNYITFSFTRTLDIGNSRAFSRAWNNSRRRAWKISYAGQNPLRLHALEFEIELGKE